MTTPQSAPWDAFKDPALTELEKQLIADLAAAKLEWEKLRNERDDLRANLAAVEAQAAGMREALVHAKTFCKVYSAGIVTLSQGDFEELREFVERGLSTDCGKSLLARLEEARWLLSESNTMPKPDGWFDRRDAWLSGQTSTTQLPQDPALLQLASWLIEHARGVGEYGLGEEWLAKEAEWKEMVGKMSGYTPTQTKKEEHDKTIGMREGLSTMDKSQKQALLGYIEEQARVADQNSKEWEASGDKVNSAYRSGMWYAYNDVRNRIPPSTELGHTPPINTALEQVKEP